MQVVNIHKRRVKQSIEKVSLVFKTLATKNDSIWPVKNWPAIRFDDGVKLGSKGGHGIVRYTIIGFKEGESISFEFTKPDGFIGTHALYLEAISAKETAITHEIIMRTNTLQASVLWIFVIRWLHDALIEEAFDTVENHFSEAQKIPKYTLWVQFLRNKYKRKSLQTNQA